MLHFQSGYSTATTSKGGTTKLKSNKGIAVM